MSKRIIQSIVVAMALITMGLAYASSEPIVSSNVVVKQNTTAAQCPSTWDGSGGSSTTNVVSGLGQSNALANTGMLSCTHCTFNAQNNSCVCAKCYDYFN